ncbi:hypothetical protein RFI_17290, partial [Reticulomyxa filosa]
GREEMKKKKLCIQFEFIGRNGGTISDMIEDVDQAVQWVMDHIESYGGDISRIFLCGQSAGAHISTMLLLQRVKEEYYKQNENNSDIKKHWIPTDLAGYISIAGPCNLVDLKDHIDKRGLYIDVLNHIMENDLRKYSPFYALCQFKPCFGTGIANRRYVLKDLKDMNLPTIDREECNEYDLQVTGKNGELTPLQPTSNNRDGLIPLDLCPVFLFHGQNDQSVPVSGTTTFAKYLEKLNVETYIKVYQNKTHTGPIIEDPIEGNDPLICDVLKVIYPNNNMERVVNEIQENIKGHMKIPSCIVAMARHQYNNKKNQNASRVSLIFFYFDNMFERLLVYGPNNTQIKR